MIGSMGSRITSMRKIGFGDAMFAGSLAALAVLSLVYGNFAPILDPFPWPKALTFALGLVLLAACIGLLFGRTVGASAIAIALFAAAWALVRTSPVVHAPQSIGSWYGFCEGVSVLAGVWTLYVIYRRCEHAGTTAPLTGDTALRVARVLFGGACLVYGIAHFAYLQNTAPLVPSWLPNHDAWAYLTGAAQVAAGVGVLISVLPRLAAILDAVLLSLFTFLVWVPLLADKPTAYALWSEFTTSWAITAGAWVVAASFSQTASKKD